MINHLISFLENYVPLTKAEINFVQQHIPVKGFRKKEFLLKEGEISQEFFFVIDGCVRLFYTLPNSEEKTGFFYLENEFVSSYESFSQQIPSKHNLQLLDDSKIAVISIEIATELLELFPKFEFLARLMMEKELIVYQEIIASFITQNPEDRYLSLLNKKSPLLQRISQNQLATFLGVTPETLSRIRKRIVSN